MKAKERISKMEQMLDEIMDQQNDINTSSQEYARHIELMLRLQDAINEMKQQYQHQQMYVSPERF
jgi:hypothetical protein